MIRLGLIVAMIAGLWGAAHGQERASLLPEVPKGTGASHPEGNEYWRRNHMELMQHDRDLTMREGEREIGASLKGCFECHSATGAGGAVVTYESPEHFCRVCHDYVAVRIDCFMCHRSTPDGVDERANHARALTPDYGTGGGAAIIAYLERIDKAGEAPPGTVVEAGQ